MKKYVNTRVLLLFCLCALLLAGAAVTYAWYRPIKLNFAPAKVDGSIRASYFESGDGTPTHPFEIAKPEQFYNLAWLQYLGRFNEADGNGAIPTTYFYLSADIDMTGYVLPPVGTEKYPFVGNFDGKGNTVTRLKIAVPTDLPIEEAYEYPQIVGAFGVVGTMNGEAGNITIGGQDYTYSSAANEVKNVTFKGLTVETQTTNALIGLAAGYVNGTLTNVGIQLDNTLMSKLDIKLDTSPLNAISANLSDHSLVGYTKDVETDTSNTVKHYQPTAARGTFTAKGETGDDETPGGGALDLNNLYGRIQAFYNDKGNSISIDGNNTKVYPKDWGESGSVTFLDSGTSPHRYLYGKTFWKRDNEYTSSPTAGNTYYVSAGNSQTQPHLTVRGGCVQASLAGYSNAIPWTISSSGQGIYAALNGNNYYLYVKDDGSLALSATEKEVWTISGKQLSCGGKYLTYNSGGKSWEMVGVATDLFFASCTDITSGANAALVDTYIPLKADAAGNTGYIISGTANLRYGDVRVLCHGRTADQGPKSYFSDGDLDEDKLYVFTNEASTIEKEGATKIREAITDGSVDETRYTKAKENFLQTVALDTNNYYSLRFYGGVADRLVNASNVTMEGIAGSNCQFPEASVDFYLKQKGYISFFAGTHSASAKSFFSLYKIERSGGDIVGIKEIREIYKDGSSYVYSYADGTTSSGSSVAGLTLAYDASLLSAQRENQLGSTSAGDNARFYYFEIPLNAGEYALGAVANGAALMYLDIGVDGGAGSTEGLIPAEAVVTRTKTTEVIVTEHRETSAPKGVDFVTTPVTVTPPTVTKATATKRLDETASGVYEFSAVNGGAACTHGGATETLGLDGTVTTAKKCIVTLTDTWQKDNAPVTRTIRVVHDGTNTTYAVTMNGETKTYTYNDLKDKADITGVGNGAANTAPKLPTPEEMAALQAAGETVLEYTYTAADAVIDSVFVPTLTAETDGTVTVTGGSYTVTSNATLTEKKRNSGYTVTYNTNTTAP